MTVYINECLSHDLPIEYIRGKRLELKQIYYICDRLKCEEFGGVCHEQCTHTTDYNHAIHKGWINEHGLWVYRDDMYFKMCSPDGASMYLTEIDIKELLKGEKKQ